MIFKFIMILFSGLIGYLIGSVNFAIVISEFVFHKDIRNYGSKNAGMTNMLRTFGKLPAFFTLIGDFSKGIISVLISNLLFYILIGTEAPAYANGIVGICALLGHVFPIFYKFKGGKGILVSAGVLIMMDWVIFLIAFSVFLLILIISRIVSLSSIIATVSYPIALLIKKCIMNSSLFDIFIETFLAVIISIIIIYMHKDNIKRLIKKDEPKLGK